MSATRDEFTEPVMSTARRILELSPEKREALNALLQRKGIRNAAIPRRKLTRAIPLSPGQQRLWFADRWQPGLAVYNLPVSFRLQSTPDAEIVRRAIREILRRHEALRTRFRMDGNGPVQDIQAQIEPEFQVVPIAGCGSEWSGEVSRLATLESRRAFDLATGPLVRSLLFTGEAAALLLITMHHIVADGSSVEILSREFNALFKAYSRGEASPLPEPVIQYSDYAHWQREALAGGAFEEQGTWWQKQLAALPTLQLPTNRPRPATQSFAGSRVDFLIPPVTAARLRGFNQGEAVTMNMTLLAAFCTLLQRYSGQDDIAVGCPVAGRNRPELEPLIGFFVNALVLRADLSGQPSFREVVARVRKVLIDSLARQDVPFEQLVQRLQPERDLSRNPLFQVSFQLFTGSEAQLGSGGGSGGGSGDASPVDRGGAMFDLAFNLWESARGIEGRVEYSTDLFDREFVEQMAGHFETLLESVLAGADRRISELPMVSSSERERLLRMAGSDDRCTADSRYIHQRVEAQAAAWPDRRAVAAGAAWISYGQLNARANRLAHGLRAAGVSSGDPVLVALDRTPDLVVALLGVLKAGGAYVPVDRNYPEERISYIREDARAAVTITGAAETWPWADDEANPEWVASARDLAYVIYTSGSTGQPKGVEVEHGSLMNLIDWHCSRYGVSANDRGSQVASVAFDAAVWEIWPYLSSGACLFMADDETREEPARMLAWLREREITIAFLPTPMAEAVLQLPIPGDLALRFLLTGGDRLRFRPGEELPFELVNHYGPTENTVVATSARVARRGEDSLDPPIGRPIANVRIYICDDNGAPVPVGIRGEICLSGAGLARGYHRNPELTAERFVSNPFEDGTRLYRTGDLGRFRADGNVEFLGRRDRQLKVRGFRIEPAEIEAALLGQAGVMQAIVVARDLPGGRGLVAYLTGTFEREELKNRLRERLPAHMIPAMFVAMKALPLTPNGKVDAAALPFPEAPQEGGPAVPLTAVEKSLTAIWRDLLHLETVGIHQDFFNDFGGHSLLTVALVSRIEEALGIVISPRVIFEAPTIAQLAQRLTLIPPTAQSRIGRRTSREHAPCSFAQRRLWFLDRLTPDSSFYNIPAALRMDTEVDPEVLERAVNRLARRHESLRTTFGAPCGEPRQFIAAEPDLSISFALVDGAREAERLAGMEARRPFDLEKGPLLRVGLLRLGERDHVLLVTLHHIISDGWSMEIFFRELVALYAAESQGKSAALADLPIQYGDYAAWEQEWLAGERLALQTRYWKQQLAGLPLLEMPADRPRPAMASYRGGHEAFRIGAGLASQLKQLAQNTRTTMFMTLLAAFEVLLYRYSGQDDFAIGTLTAGRGRKETEGLIGFFVNTLALRADMRGNPSFRELLARVKETALEAYAHAELPFEKLVEELHPQRDLSRNPLVQVTFQLFNPQRFDSRSAQAGVGVSASREMPVERTVSTFDMAFDMWEADGELAGRLEYSTDLFDSPTVARMLGGFSELLRGIAEDPDGSIEALPLQTAEAVHRQVVEWNDTARQYPEQARMSEMFEAQAAESPDAMAVESEGEQLSYARLNERASQVAAELRAKGAGAASVVGICLPRSVEWIAAILGVLKAGAAFLPIDPEHPVALKETMLRDAGATLMVGTEGRIEPRVASASIAAGAAYVIYTSGSTGRRKAVVVEDRALTNHALGIIERFGITAADRMLQFASPGFDVALEEIFPALLAGAALILPAAHAVIPPRELIAFMRRHHVTIANLPSPYWHEWADSEACGSVPETLRLLVVGSDRTDARLMARWRERNGKRPRVVHAYGVTECTITSLTYEVRGGEAELPVGRPLPNVRAYILDKNLQPSPGGAIGDLYVGGAGVARGYLSGPSDAFLKSPFDAGRLYRTGDRARYREDGDIVFAGRRDDQIKIRGFRIEPSEIETALRSDASVREAAVVMTGDARLVAYVVAVGAWSAEGALTGLRALLPAYMVPQNIIQIDEMPRSSSGKTDLGKLRQLAAAAGAAPLARPAFAGDAEHKIAAIWEETLAIHAPGPDDNFFDLGGHSLALLRVHSRIEAAFATHVSVIDLFRYPTVRTLAEFLGRETQIHS